MQRSEKSVIVSETSDGIHLSVVGDIYRIIVSGEQTNGDFAIIEMEVPPGGGPGPHAHDGFHETFFVLEGEVEVQSESGVQRVSKGMCATIPKGGMVHGFKNRGTAMARMLCFVAPAGLDKFFQEIGKQVQPGEFLPPPVMDADTLKQIQTIAARYGQQLYPPDFFDKK